MECIACIRTCPTNAIEKDKGVSCVRLERSTPLRVDEGKCNECNRCNEVCPMGDIALSAEGCSFCIICKSNPSCLLHSDDRTSFLNLFISIARYVMLKCRMLIFRLVLHNQKLYLL